MNPGHPVSQPPDPATTEQLGPAEAAAWIASDRPPLVIDCRTRSEHALCHLPDDLLIPLAAFTADAPSRISGPNQPVLVYCHHGIRSLNATRWLRANGFANAFSLRGGIDAWSLQVDPSLPRY